MGPAPEGWPPCTMKAPVRQVAEAAGASLLPALLLPGLGFAISGLLLDDARLGPVPPEPLFSPKLCSGQAQGQSAVQRRLAGGRSGGGRSGNRLPHGPLVWHVEGYVSSTGACGRGARADCALGRPRCGVSAGGAARRVA